MLREPANELRKQMLLLTAALGMMTGVAVYAVVKAIQQERPALFAVVLLLAVIAIPTVRALARLRKQQASVAE